MISKKLLQILACPNCQASLIKKNGRLVCLKCSSIFNMKERIIGLMPNDGENINNNLFLNEKNLFEDTSKEWLRETKIPRYRYLVSWIKKILSSFEFRNAKILELGCGVSQYIKIFHKSNIIIAGDISRQLLKNNGLSAFLIQLNIAYLPFRENSFDFVFMVGALHHIPASLHKNILDKIFRILKPGCYILLVEPNIFSLSGIYYLIRRCLVRLKCTSLLKRFVGFVSEDERYLNINKIKKIFTSKWFLDKYYTIQYFRFPPIGFFKNVNIEPLNYPIDLISKIFNISLFGTTIVVLARKDE